MADVIGLPVRREPEEPEKATWRQALVDSQKQIADAYIARADLFRRANDAGLSYMEIARATGLSNGGVAKIIGRKQRRRASLDDRVDR